MALAGWSLRHPFLFEVKQNWKSAALGFLLLLLTIAAYSSAFRCGFIWDDDDYVTRNQTLRDLEGLQRIWFEPGATSQYYPLVHTSFWLEYHVWGLHAAGYHIDNVVLHALAAILLWNILRRLPLSGAWFAAVIFALHPVAVESVAWITERKNVLSAVLYFGAALAYLHFWRLRERAEGTRKSQWWWYALAGLLFVGALLSKTVTCSLPAALLLARYWKRGRIGRGDMALLLPFFIVGVSLSLLTIWLEKNHVGAQGVDWSLSIAQRCLIAGRAVWFYAAKLVWPTRLTFVYPRWNVNAASGWQWLFPIAAVALIWLLWKLRGRFGRGPLVAVLFFAGTLLPALGFVNVYPMRYSFVADHFQYLACVGLIALLVSMLLRLPVPGKTIVYALPLLLALLTWRQLGEYKDLETLWRDTLTRDPNCWLAHNNLGVIFQQQGKLPEAEAEFRATVALNPRFAEGLSSLGGLLCGTGRAAEGIPYCRRALELYPSYPNAHFNLGNGLMSQGQYVEAIQAFEAVVKIKPSDYQARQFLARALEKTGKRAEAAEEYRLALQSKPDDASLNRDLAAALFAEGKAAEAVPYYQQALRQEGNDAATHYALGLALSIQGRWDEAIEHYQETLRVGPEDAEVEYNLGYALEVRGRLDEAAVQLTAALRLRPEFPLAHYNLGCVLANQGRRGEAAAHLREALELKPDYEEARQKLRMLEDQDQK